MNRDKEHLLILVEELEQQVFELECETREDEDNEDLFLELQATENELAYYQSCLEDYD
jgi:hypothetical protein